LSVLAIFVSMMAYSQTCDPNCIYSVKISNINKPEAEYANGAIFCCNGPKEDCVPNDCVVIRIDSTNRRILLVQPDICP